MLISTSTTDQDWGRPKLKTKTLDGTAVDDEDGPGLSTRQDGVPPSPGKLLSKGRGGQGVPSWLQGPLLSLTKIV